MKGKFDQTSPQPTTPSWSSARTNTAGRFIMRPNEVTTGVDNG
jgi:hypothetical protein